MTRKRERTSLLEHLGWVPFACVIGAVLIVSVAGLTWNISPYYGRNDGPAHAGRNTGADVGEIPLSGGKYSINLAPDRIEIPKLRAVAPIVDVATSSDGELEIPRNPKVVGWWKPGARPGDRVGTAIFAGHINYAGVTGTLSSIGKLRPGDRVDVYGKNARQRKMIEFEVTGVRTYHKTALPFRQIFDQQSVGRMALVTCGGPFDASTGNYLDNIVVFAIPVGSRPA